jgi:leader peptidase (prepilin peptidase) / N-methyltransferase
MINFLMSNTPLLITVAFFFGLLVGSFLNVVILRLPARLLWHARRESRELLELPEVYESAPPDIVVKGSHCPHCQHKLSAFENIPLISFLIQRGRCRHCKTAISWQYPAIELLTGILFAICIWKFGITWQAGAGLVFTACLVSLTGIDIRTQYLPDDITLPLLWLGLAISLVPLFVDPGASILGAAVGYLSLWSVYKLFKLITGKEGMGYGDFKLLAALGAWCGAKSILSIVLMSSLLGAVIGSIYLMIIGRDKATPIPFGPYLAAAGWIQFILGVDLLAAYMNWAVPGN